MCRINGTHTHPHCNCLSEKTLHHVATAVPELLRSSGGSSEICLVITSMSFINKRAWTFGHCCCWRWRWCISYVGRNDHTPNIKYTTPCFNLQWCQKRKGARSSMENFNFFLHVNMRKSNIHAWWWHPCWCAAFMLVLSRQNLVLIYQRQFTLWTQIPFFFSPLCQVRCLLHYCACD